MKLVMPAGSASSEFDMSCVRAVDLYVNGKTYPANTSDWALDCVDVPAGAATFEDVREAIAGKFEVKLPMTGLSGVEVYAFSGPCNAPRPSDYDLAFYSSAAYTGHEPLELPIVPNVSCRPVETSIRPVDILKLVASKQCATSAWSTGRLALGTFSPTPFTQLVSWWGGQTPVETSNGVAQVRGPLKVGPTSCLAIGLFTTGWESASCATPFEQRVCASANEIEVPMVNTNVAIGSQDQAKITQYGSLLIGAVYGTAPVSGAKVTIDDPDKEKGKVVYFDLPAGVENGTGALTETTATMTGPSGLFGIYTQSMVNITITSGTTTIKRTVGAASGFPAAMVVKI